MSRLTPLYKIESFRKTVMDLIAMNDVALASLRKTSLDNLSATVTNAPINSEEEILVRAYTLLYEAAVRDGFDDVAAELKAAFSDAPEEQMQRLLASITPAEDDEERVTGLDERDGFLPILVSQRFALDLRVTDGKGGAPIATPFVSARLEFDSSVGTGSSAVVFQVNLADIDELVGRLLSVRERAASLVASSEGVTIPEWGHGLPS